MTSERLKRDCGGEKAQKENWLEELVHYTNKEEKDWLESKYLGLLKLRERQVKYLLKSQKTLVWFLIYLGQWP